MRSLKKSLVLVLVLAMAVSMMAVGASASSSTFTDSSKVGTTYAEAVDLLTGIGVVNGTTSTTLEPTANYTREQAAKVICYLALGKTAADALSTSSAPFSDVAADRWSAGYIAYCVSQGIIVGNGDGTFNPTGALTGYAWGKMLVTALGYNKAGEFTGSSWEINVAKQALSLGVYKNDTTAATNAKISRQQAMLMAYNTMFLGTVEAQLGRDNGTTYVTSYTTGKPSLASSVYGYGATSGKAFTAAASSAANNTLVKVASTVNGTDGYNWYYNNTTTPVTAFYSSETLIGSSTNGKSISTLSTYSTTNSYYIADLASPTYYLNGTVAGTFAASTDYAVGTVFFSANKLYTVTTAITAADGFANLAAAAAKLSTLDLTAPGYGTKIDFVSTDAAGDTTTAEKVYVTTYYVDTVKAAPVVKVNPTDGKSYVYIDMNGTDIGSSTTYTVLASKVTGFSGLVADDVVTVTAKADGSFVITKANTFTGTATAQSGTALTISGTTYNASAMASSTISSYSQGFLNNVAFYTDANGYLVYAKAVTAVTSDYAFILQNGTYTSSNVTSATNQSYVAFKDGSTATITVASVDGTKFTDGTMTTPVVNDIYTYSKNSDGTYALTSKTEAESTKYTTTADADGVITQGVSASTSTSGNVIKGDANTIYVVRSIKTNGTNAVDLLASGTAFQQAGTTYNTTWNVYTGYTNMITASNAYYVAVNGTDGYADIVFVTNYATTATTASSVIYMLSTTPTAVYKDASTIDYYTFPAIVDGVKTVVKATTGTIASLNALNGSVALNDGTMCKVTYTDGKLAAGSITPINGTSAAASNGAFVYGTGITAPANGLINIGGTDYAYSSSTYVFYISADQQTVTMGLADSLSDNTTATVSAVTNAASVINAGGTPTAAQQNSLYAIYVQLAD